MIAYRDITVLYQERARQVALALDGDTCYCWPSRSKGIAPTLVIPAVVIAATKCFGVKAETLIFCEITEMRGILTGSQWNLSIHREQVHLSTLTTVSIPAAILELYHRRPRSFIRRLAHSFSNGT
jgi:hypothetical protein